MRIRILKRVFAGSDLPVGPNGRHHVLLLLASDAAISAIDRRRISGSSFEPSKLRRRRRKPHAFRRGRKTHQPDLFIFFTLASVASIEAASSNIAFANRSAASLGSCDRSARSA